MDGIQMLTPRAPCTRTPQLTHCILNCEPLRANLGMEYTVAPPLPQSTLNHDLAPRLSVTIGRIAIIFLEKLHFSLDKDLTL